jgi:hypothetical protein
MKSLHDVATISDQMTRLTEAALLVREAEAETERLRTERDLAVLVLLRPFADAVAPANAARADLRAALEAGTITGDEFRAALAENRDRRRDSLVAAKVKIYPVEVYEALGVGRSLVNRILMRMPNEPLPPVDEPADVARAAHGEVKALEHVIRAAREIRDTAAVTMMSGHDDDGDQIPPVSNAQIARATNLTTARIAVNNDLMPMVVTYSGDTRRTG